MEQISKKKEAVDFFLKRGILLSSDVVDALENFEETHKKLVQKIKTDDFLFLNKDLNDALSKVNNIDINWPDIEKARALFDKDKDKKIYQKFIDYLNSKDKAQVIEETEDSIQVKVVFNYKEESKKRDIQDFVRFFNARYKALEKMLRARQELRNLTSISRIISKKERDTVSLIGMVKEKSLTKNENIMLTLEDPTSFVKVLINKNKPDLYEQSKSIVLDEVIGVVGVNGDNIVFANNVLWPEVLRKDLKKSHEKAYAIFLSDLHVGSKNFLEEDFNKFLRWIKGETGNEKQKEIAKNVKYLFVVGDLIDGCGVYPEQDKELVIKDVYQQYEECAKLLKQIPKGIKIIICPGNHDAMRLAEPQPPLYEDFARPVYAIPNAIFVSNPAMINIHSSKTFPGFDVLLYHGYSFDYFVANVDSIRNNGGYDRADLIMKFLLRRRHLAPTHTSNLYLPDTERDPLVIEKVPDFFITGHLHKSIAANYKNVTMICGSCWQSKTTFQEKVGHNPEPSRVPIVNLKTREIKILRFGS